MQSAVLAEDYARRAQRKLSRCASAAAFPDVICVDCFDMRQSVAPRIQNHRQYDDQSAAPLRGFIPPPRMRFKSGALRVGDAL